MSKLAHLIKQARQSAVLWSWGFNGLRLASGLILLPLLVRLLPKPEFGMYYVLLSLSAIVPFLDLGISGTVGRFVGYAMAGATELRSQGYVPAAGGPSSPNCVLLWKLLRATRLLYAGLAGLGTLVLALWGTIVVWRSAGDTTNPRLTWLAWGLTLIAGGIELYAIWWNAFLYCMNKVQQSARIGFWTYLVRVAVSCLLLVSGLGLLSVPIGSIVGSLCSRFAAKRAVLNVLGPAPAEPERLAVLSLLKLAWPNSWRLALQSFSSYIRSSAMVQICAAYFGLGATGDFGFSQQIINLVYGMALVWTTVKWPRVMQLRSVNDVRGMRELLCPRLWLQTATFVLLAAAAILLGPFMLEVLGTDKRLLPPVLLILLGFTGLLDLHFVFWGTLLATENRIPTLWSTVLTSVLTLTLAAAMLEFFSFGMLAIVLAPLIAGLAFIYWYWPRAGANSLGTTWPDFAIMRCSSPRGRVRGE